ncbi:MAG: c-type cytochrome biogenesis protein CcmI, partial [Proteobacteria bacterium]|nr:c-type cytochrome biogenesis protein CcmI [Pseudomonadota bacterium]
VAQVEAHLEQKPTDGQGWEVVAPVYMRIGRFDDAAKARANALRLLGPSAEREAALGEALVMQANGMVTADAKAAFARALAREPGEPRATYYLGIAAEQDGRNAEAARLWSEMLARGPADAPWVAVVRAALARVATAPAATATAPSAADPPATAPSAPGPSAPGPSAQDVATAAQMAPEDRNAMIAGMVTRLAERLGREGGDVEGWIRLLRAYMVLGDREKLRAAITDARRALAAMPDKLRQLDAAIKDIGLDG